MLLLKLLATKKIMQDVKVKHNPVPQEIAQPDSPLPRKKLMICPLRQSLAKLIPIFTKT